jgi:hypothetical protein
MNPYLEQDDTWPDFHINFITHAQKALVAKVSGSYLVKLEVQLYLHESSARERERLPAVDVERHCWLAIRDRQTRQLITAINLISPTHKIHGPIRDDFLQRRRNWFLGQVNVVEIDLRRGNKRPVPPELPECDYYALVSAATERPRVRVWPVPLRSPMPVVTIPLKPTEPEVALDLQSVLHNSYDDADYGKYVYQEAPDPPLSVDDAAWARQFVPRRQDQ